MTITAPVNNKEQQQQQPLDTIRHAGRCHVRGKIQRVWRPRYLELWDHGVVRYYELPHQTLKCTLQVLQARIIDVTTLRDMHVGLPRGTFGFCLSALRSEHGANCTEPSFGKRDFLCAVATLEEAQSWVVALQWAASLAHTSAWESDEELYHAAATLMHPLKANALQVVAQSVPSMELTAKKINTQLTKQKQQLQGTIVVTKVQSLRIIRHATGGVNVAYQISLLLVRPGSSRAEQRLIARTRQDIYDVLLDLREESTSSSRLVLTEAQELMKDIPTNYFDFVTSLARIERVMRSLAMDAGICNSAALRRFWALDKSLLHRPLLNVHITNNVISIQDLGDVGDTEAFVKEWLSRGTMEKYSWYKSLMLWGLQNPFYVAGGFLIPLVVVRPVLYLREHAIPALHMKSDVLLLSWVVAAYLGREYEKQQRPRRRRPSVDEDVNSLDDEEPSTSIDDEIISEQQQTATISSTLLSSPLPRYPANGGTSCWSKPNDTIFRVRSVTYLQDRIKAPSGPAPFKCRGVDVWLTDNPERHIARHPSVLGGLLEKEDTFLVNFLLPFGNFVSYFGIPPLNEFPPKLRGVWTRFLQGDQQYRDARLKLLPVVVDGPWIVKAAVGQGTAPALLGKVIPLQYYFRSPTENQKGVYEVDVIITASRIAKGILSVVKGHTNALTIAFGFIIEASEQDDLPETVLCSFQMHSLHLEDCSALPDCNLDELTGEH